LIFVALGTHEQPFARALEIVAPLTEDYDLVVQHGVTPVRDDLPRSTWVRFTDYDRVCSLVRESSYVICHAGVGLIMTAMREGKKPIVIPRLAAYGEHVDDHQLQIATEFAKGGRVVLASGDIRAALKEADSPQPWRDNPGELSAQVWKAIGLDEPDVN
jgi:UDP-N-acetylglucosamine--N-acetylmuramyl-(pentapeptide) pyrophosphoryl-undecaprenol N-acetylglucosamine transferase